MKWNDAHMMRKKQLYHILEWMDCFRENFYLMFQKKMV